MQATYSEHSETGHDGLSLPNEEEYLRRSSSGSLGGAGGGGSSGMVRAIKLSVGKFIVKNVFKLVFSQKS